MQIDPIAFKIFGIPIYWYGIMISLGLLLGALVAIKRTKIYQFNEDDLLNFILIAVPSAVIGARLVFVVTNWSTFSGNWSDMLNLRLGGLSIHGAIIGAIIACGLYAYLKNLNFWKIADICSPGLILGQAIGRWGNYFNQEAYGVQTDVPWAMYIDGAYRHPIFLYESIWNLLVFAYLLFITKREKASGGIFLRYIIGYSIGRFFIEGIRDNTLFWQNFRAGQVVSVVFIAVGILLLLWRKRQAPQSEKGDIR